MSGLPFEPPARAALSAAQTHVRFGHYFGFRRRALPSGWPCIIVVISVMSGFDKQLRDTFILGFNAHIEVIALNDVMTTHSRCDERRQLLEQAPSKAWRPSSLRRCSWRQPPTHIALKPKRHRALFARHRSGSGNHRSAACRTASSAENSMSAVTRSRLEACSPRITESKSAIRSTSPPARTCEKNAGRL